MADPDTIKNSGKVTRVQDAWAYHEDVRAIAANHAVLDLLQKLYGRRPFPFQTLNFPVGTQQHLHSGAGRGSRLVRGARGPASAPTDALTGALDLWDAPLLHSR